ncbi:protein TESPA1 [Patagioenas fasciata monilis]|uniref:Protein TESPA1 n=1 Tax=Patagioenas fasciata monilis TaxID=372326 RepID=A0A1V4JLG0_PATFA|nr:protein TESPA1 [Patagioenas fasciata monilis]
MEGTSVLSPSWWEKRRAWAWQSRSWRPTVPDEDEVAPDEDEVAPATRGVPELPPPHLDDVFLEGSPSRKIETWLQECRSLVEEPEEPGSPGPLGCGNNGTSFEDDLTLGAEALLLLGSHKATGRTPRDKPPSVASSSLSSLPTKTSCSVAAVLAWRQEDAEEILASLGFAHSEPGAMARVPPRFLATPSRARGMDVGLFLRAQARRLETEEPGLALAGRFQQAQALAATADSFFCLYSYVSRTPVRCICPPRPAWPCPPVPGTRVSPPAQPATLSPVERLKKVLPSTSEDDDDDDDNDNDNEGDTHVESGRSLCPSVTIRRSFMLHGGSGRSDSSGFVEEPVWGHPPPRLCDTDQMA